MLQTLIIGNYNYSSWSLRAWLALRKTGAEFQVLRLPMDTPEFERRVREFSPTGRVPVLRDDDRVIWDSLAICEYLAERYPQARLWPAAAAARALGRCIAAEMHSGLSALREEFPMNCRALGRQVQPSALALGDLARVDQWIADCRALQPGSGWLLGEFSITDSMLVPVLLRFNTYGLARTAATREYMDWVLADADVREWMENAAREPEIIEHEER